jgi:hypothetical protein
MIHQALQELAWGCKSRVFGRFSSPVCPGLRRIALAVVPEWYQEMMDYHSSNTPE